MRGLLTLALALALLSTPAPSQAEDDALPSLKTIKGWQAEKGVDEPSPQREKLLKQKARHVAMNAALAWRSREYDTLLKSQAVKLNQIFDFTPILQEQQLLFPPICTHSKNTMINDGKVMRIIRQRYAIVTPERLISRPPHWRTYLLAPALEPVKKLPDPQLPFGDDERKLWAEQATEGWQRGLKLADTNVQRRIARLMRDFSGTTLCLILQELGIATKTKVSRKRESASSDGKELKVGEEIIRISKPAKLTRRSKRWRAYVQMPNAFALRFGDAR